MTSSAVDGFVAEAMAASGRIDILVNNAGGVLGQVGRPLESISPSDWQAIFDVNVTGAFYCSQAVAPAMKTQRAGRIINISSGAGLGHLADGNSSVRVGEGGADRPDTTACARAGTVGHHGQQHRAGVRSIECDDRAAVGVVRRGWPTRARRSHRAQATRDARRHRVRRDVLRVRVRRVDHGPGAVDRRREVVILCRAAARICCSCAGSDSRSAQ